MAGTSLFDTVVRKAEPEQQTPVKQTSEQKIAREKTELENRLANLQLDDVRTRVAYVLNQYPSCRNSDVELVIKFWKLFFAESLQNDGIPFDALREITPMTSVVRARATIQNTFGLFVSDGAVAELRDERQQQQRKKHRAVATTVPFVQIFCDESGKTDKHYIVGSLWVNDADEQAFTLAKRLTEWRKSIAWDREFHFAQMTSAQAETYVQFMERALETANYVGFKAIVLPREDVKRRPTEEAIYQLYYRLIVEGIRHELETGRFTLPRSVNILKDKDADADKLHLQSLRDQLGLECPKQFDYQVNINGVVSLESSSVILMQLADVFTGCVNRILNQPQQNPQRNHKDRVADEIIRKLGGNPDRLLDGAKTDFLRIIRL